MIRFLHTSDWQLGMTRRFLTDGADERYTQARFDAVCRLAELARVHDCRAVLVAGDAFDSNQVDRRTVARAFEALAPAGAPPPPVYILPGNHDAYDDASVYRSAPFLDKCPERVTVASSFDPIPLAEDVELIPAPWLARREAVNPVAEALRRLRERVPAGAATPARRLLLAHGMVDTLSPDRDAPGQIPLALLEEALSDGLVHYVALGDRHSLTRVDAGGKVWYSGTPETTAYTEVDSGQALLVTLHDDGSLETMPLPVGAWHFLEPPPVELNGGEDLAALSRHIDALPDKSTTVLKLRLRGTLDLADAQALEARIDAARDVLAAVEIRDRDLAVVPGDADFADYGFSGFASATVERLSATASQPGIDPETARRAREALGLLRRLAEAKP